MNTTLLPSRLRKVRRPVEDAPPPPPDPPPASPVSRDAPASADPLKDDVVLVDETDERGECPAAAELHEAADDVEVAAPSAPESDDDPPPAEELLADEGVAPPCEPESATIVVDTKEPISAAAMAQQHTTKELKDMALRIGVSQAGKKTDICKRIIEARSSPQDVPPA